MVEAHARTEGKRTKEATAHGVHEAGPQKIGGDWAFQKSPAFLAERAAFFDKLMAAQKEQFAALPQ